MFNFSEFCKEKKCQHYKEWHVQAGKDGMVRCCDLVGTSFYVTTFPDTCIHFDEIAALKASEKEKDIMWKKLLITTEEQAFRDQMTRIIECLDIRKDL